MKVLHFSTFHNQILVPQYGPLIQFWVSSLIRSQHSASAQHTPLTIVMTENLLEYIVYVYKLFLVVIK